MASADMATTEALDQEIKALEAMAEEPLPPAEEMDVLELISALEEVKSEEETVKLCKIIAKMTSKSAEDRDTFGSFDGLATLYQAVKRNNSKSGAAMRAFMLMMPAVCHKSAVNRGIVRDDGALDDIVNMLLRICHEKHLAPGNDGDMPDIDTRSDDGQDLGAANTAKADNGEDEEKMAVVDFGGGDALAACIALEALCKANDGNKKAAARIKTDFNAEEIEQNPDDVSVPLFKTKEGALEAFMTILESAESDKLKVHAFRALRTLTQDDDNRQLSCVPSAVENREFCSDEQHFPRMRKIMCAAMDDPSSNLAQVVMLLMKDMCWHQNRIHALVYEDKVLPKIIKTMFQTSKDDADTVRSVLVVLRQFCFSDDMKRMLVFETEAMPWIVSAVKKHTNSPRILEQAFGLFSNLLLRMPKIAAFLAAECDMLSMAHTVMHNYPNNGSLMRTVVQCMRNVSKVEEALAHIMDSVVLDDLRDIVKDHENDPAWRDAVEISKTFLRELREDAGLRAAPKWNEFY